MVRKTATATMAAINYSKASTPSPQRQQTLQQTMTNFQHVQFPSEGIRRYEQVKDRLLHESQQLMQLKAASNIAGENTCNSG